MIVCTPVRVGLGLGLTRAFAIEKDSCSTKVGNELQTSEDLKASLPKSTVCAPAEQVIHMRLRTPEVALACQTVTGARSCRSRTAGNTNSNSVEPGRVPILL